ncbi:MAG: Hsp20 family protein [Rhizobiales bacterium]|nr:Hsp20 family protein [Hyphomicrobiales bacterium]
MRHIDYSPFYRSSVGFDRLFSLLDNVTTEAATNSYPPYNIERTSSNAYRITMAVAGFAESDIDIETKDTVLTIKGGKAEDKREGVEILHQGIASRAFERRFQLADHVEVVRASLEHGLLHIDLVREVPEAMKPRKIAVAIGDGSTSRPAGKQIEAEKVN